MQKYKVGRLSAFCGAVSAGTAAACGIAFLQGADADYTVCPFFSIWTMRLCSCIISTMQLSPPRRPRAHDSGVQWEPH